MPFGDGTGPRGMGPMTGRGAGYCTGFAGRGFASSSLGRSWFGFNRNPGRGTGRGRGRGMSRRGFNPFPAYARW
jgi:hypothetical protein